MNGILVVSAFSSHIIISCSLRCEYFAMLFVAEYAGIGKNKLLLFYPPPMLLPVFQSTANCTISKIIIIIRQSEKKFLIKCTSSVYDTAGLLCDRERTSLIVLRYVLYFAAGTARKFSFRYVRFDQQIIGYLYA